MKSETPILEPMQNWKQLYDAVVNGDAQCARTLTEQALGAGVVPLTLVNDSMMPAMAEGRPALR